MKIDLWACTNKYKYTLLKLNWLNEKKSKLKNKNLNRHIIMSLLSINDTWKKCNPCQKRHLDPTLNLTVNYCAQKIVKIKTIRRNIVRVKS